METMEAVGKTGRGGARVGAGRKRISDIERKTRTVYCDSQELLVVKALLATLRRVDAANRDIAAAKGDAARHKAAVLHSILVQDEVKAMTIAQLVDDSGAIILGNLK